MEKSQNSSLATTGSVNTADTVSFHTTTTVQQNVLIGGGVTQGPPTVHRPSKSTHRHQQTDYCTCKWTRIHTNTCDEDHMVTAAGTQAVRKRGTEVQDLVWPKPLGPNRIKRLGYYRAYWWWASWDRETHSAFTHVFKNTADFQGLQPGWENQHQPNAG